MFKILLMYALFILPAAAFANLQVFPTRILLTERDRTAQISVRHAGDKPTRYRIETVYFRMLPNGAMERVSDPRKAEQTAAAYFRFSPQQVTLEPNVEQVVRIMLRMPADLAEGEYRAHLYFEQMDDPVSKTPSAEIPANAAQMDLKARLAIAVPIIVRKGALDLKVELSNLKMIKAPDGALSYAVDVTRQGKSFLFGDFKVHFTPQGTKESTLVGQANGVSSYLEKRVVSYPLQVDKLGKGSLKVEFYEPAADGGKLLAATTTELK